MSRLSTALDLKSLGDKGEQIAQSKLPSQRELDRGEETRDFCFVYLIAYGSLVNKLYATKYLFFTPFNSTQICWESRIFH